jgi:hypothetical protein
VIYEKSITNFELASIELQVVLRTCQVGNLLILNFASLNPILEPEHKLELDFRTGTQVFGLIAPLDR